MESNATYLKWCYRRNLLRSRSEEINRGIIGKLNRKIRKYEEEHKEG